MARAPGLIVAAVVGLALAACATPERFRTVALLETRSPEAGYRVERALAGRSNVELFVVLSFSGGGTRSGALAYGVLEELARHEVVVHGEKKRLLDEVGIVYGVSGGAVPAAYYGAFGDRIFERFVPDFLETDFQWALGPTWKLTRDEVDLLRLTARDLLRKSPDFQRLMRDIGAAP